MTTQQRFLFVETCGAGPTAQPDQDKNANGSDERIPWCEMFMVCPWEESYLIKALKFHKVDPQDTDKEPDPPEMTRGHLSLSIQVKRMLYKLVDTSTEMPGLQISS